MEKKKIIQYHTLMKRILFVLAVAIPVLMGCTGKTKTLKLADFTITYPSSYEVEDTEDCFPDDATFYIQGKNGQLSMNTVVYYAESELDYIGDLYEEGLTGFIENKLDELFGTFESGALFKGIVVEDLSELFWDDDKLGGTLYASGKWDDSDDEWIAGLRISLKGRGALVTCVALAEDDEETVELLEITDSIEFDPRSESYQPSADVMIQEAQE